MIIADLMAELAEAGAPMQAIMIAVRAVEYVSLEVSRGTNTHREKNRQRQQRFRDKHRNATDNVTSNVTGVPPCPPIDNITLTPPTPSPSLSLEDKSSSSSSARADDLFPVEKISKPKSISDDLKAELLAFGISWNDLAAAFKLPSIEYIKPGTARERHAIGRLKDLRKDYNLGSTEYIARIRGSPYLRGEINGFRATFDWICNPQNFTKIMDGNYESTNKKSFGAASSSHAYHSPR